jgi:hypothetical protein
VIVGGGISLLVACVGVYYGIVNDLGTSDTAQIVVIFLGVQCAMLLKLQPEPDDENYSFWSLQHPIPFQIPAVRHFLCKSAARIVH